MNKFSIIVYSLLIAISGFAQEKEIDFNKGTVNICTTAQIKISGYNGDQVVIKNTNPRRYQLNSKGGQYFNIRTTQDSFPMSSRRDSVSYIFFTGNSKEREAKAKGLKPLGKSVEEENVIDMALDINIVSGELIIRDKNLDSQNGLIFYGGNTYEVLIPNSVKLRWNIDNCNTSKAQSFMFSSTNCEVSNFSGSTEITSLYRNVSLTDVTGPALVNTVGGDIKVVFTKERPKELFSLISNDGDIDLTLPNNSKVSMNITGKEVLSNLDFTIKTENILQDKKNLQVDLNGGGKTITTETEYGTVYLRKQ